MNTKGKGMFKMFNDETLVDVIEAKNDMNHVKGITFINGEKDETYLSYKDLYGKALGYLYHLQSNGLKPGMELIFQLNDNETFLYTFWACLLGGIIPVPVSMGNNEEHRLKIVKIWNILNQPYLITDNKSFSVLERFISDNNFVGTIGDIKNRSLLTEDMTNVSTPGSIHKVSPGDIAFIQFSSGSTGDPKGVVLTHENLLTNIRAMFRCAECGPQDSFLSWMPLTHDMGMNGFHLLPVVYHLNQFIMPTALFVRRPTLWLKKATEHQITILASPNFGYQYVLSFLKPEIAASWDLSNVRLILNGAEPISADICHKFLNEMEKYGLKKNTMFTVYGLAEASLGVAFPPVGEEFVTVHLNRESLHLFGQVQEIDGRDKRCVPFVEEGYPIDDCNFRICNDKGQLLNDNIIGYIQIKGKNVTGGYYNNPEATAEIITAEGWLNTGDLGFMRNGRLVVTGRLKDIIFVNGQNFYPYDIERVAEEVAGIELGKIAVCAVPDAVTKEEAIIAFVMFKHNVKEFVPLTINLKKCISAKMGITLKDVVPVRNIPKTTSGKIQRYKLGEDYSNGKFSEVLNEIQQSLNREISEKPFEDPTSQIERNLLTLCREVLKIEKVGLDDSFLEMGINSLQLGQIAEKLDEIYPNKVTVTDFFAYPTIKKLAEFIEKQGSDLKPDLSKEDCATKKDIAIIGISLKFPMAENVTEFWSNLQDGRDCITNLSQERQKDAADFLSRLNMQGRDNRFIQGGYLDEIDKFDYGFFHLSPKEAALMDPNQRLFLQTVWNAIEDAGYGGEKLAGANTGVYVGFSKTSFDYERLVSEVDPAEIPNFVVGNLPSIIASRIAYWLDLQGPTMVVDTACSSSLVAIHLACQGIKNGDCEMAIAGGVKTIPLPVKVGLGMESSDDRTRSFDDASDGTGLGEGVAALLLKPLSKAIEDGDHIYAVIKGSAINQDGATVGITAPNPIAQSKVIVKAWEDAGVNPETITYIEAHGTGTKLGDPVEVAGLQKAFRKYTLKTEFCALGSVKSNIGHLYEAAGIAGVIKAVLALKYQKIPPTIHFQTPNRNIDFRQSPVYVNDRLLDWESMGSPRRCGVSSFGFSGTNCHLVLEEAPPEVAGLSKKNAQNMELLTLSAKSQDSLRALISRYRSFLSRETGLSFSELCYTGNTGRGHYNYRLAILIKDEADLKRKIDHLDCLADLAKVDLDGVFYGSHKITAADSKIEGEITETEKRELSQAANSKLTEFIKTGDESLLLDVSKLYIQGAEVVWETLYKGKKLKKISLPVYPFERKRCWIDVPRVALWNETEPYYSIEWRREDFQSLSSGIMNQGTTVIFGDETGIGWEITDKLRKEGLEVVEVHSGSKFEFVGSNVYRVGNCEEDYLKLFGAMRDKRLTRIIHLASVTNQKGNCDLAELKKSQENSVLSLFFLTRALIKIGIQSDLEINVISKYGNPVTGTEERIQPENATLFGLGKAIGREFPQLRVKGIDCDDFTPGDTIIGELKEASGTYLIAYRNGERYIEEVNPAWLDRKNDAKVSIKSNGVYVITGGTGGIGLEVAKFLASKTRVNLALINRSPMPDSKNWAAILQEATDPKLCHKIRVIQEIQAAGSNVACYRADISDLNQVELLMEELRAKYGRINGLIHAAGNTGHELLVNQEEADFKNILAPKVDGTWVLDATTEADDLDFFVVFSSIATVFSAPAQGGYIAANAYLDSFAAQRSKKNKRTLAINWVAWKDTGMAVESGLVSDTAFKAIATSEAIKAFERVLNKDITRIIIGEINYQSGMAQLLLKQPIKMSEVIGDKIAKSHGKEAVGPVLQTKSRLDQVILQGRENDEYTETERQLGQIWGEALGYKKINVTDDFYDLGGDSILATAIVNQLQKQLGKSVKIVDVLNYLTIESFAKYLDENQPNQENSGLSLKPVEKSEYYPTSSPQKRLLFLDKLEDLGISYNLPSVRVIHGPLDRQRFEDAFRVLIQRHESLRTSFEFIDGIPVQRVHADVDFQVVYQEGNEAEIDDLARQFIKPFDVSKAPLFRVGLIKLSENKHLFLFDMHHTISDGISMTILVKEFSQLYQGESLPELPIQYKDFAVWQNELFKKGQIKNQEDYWLDVFKGEIPVLNLPMDYQRPSIQSFAGDKFTFQAGRELTQKLNALASETGTTLYMVLLAAYNVLLAKYSGQEDIIVGSPIAGRRHADLENIVGIFVNTLAMRNYPQFSEKFHDFLLKVKTNALNAYENQDYPFEELVEHLGLARDVSRNPLTDTVFVLQNVGNQDIQIANLDFTAYDYKTQIAQFDLVLNARESAEDIGFTLEYGTQLYRKETIVKMAGHFLNILREVSGNPEISLGQIDILSAAEKKQLLVDFNRTRAEYPKEKTIQELFEEQVSKRPDQIAVVFKDQQLTYRELNEKANQLARVLREKGVGQDSVVGLLVRPSLEMFIGALGILKSGGSYLPIDHEYPQERIRYMLEDSYTGILLTQKEFNSGFDFPAETLDLEDETLYQGKKENLSHSNRSNNLAYIIYTSGSTGKPKGVMIEHRSLINLCQWHINDYQVTNSDKSTKYAGFGFDASVWEIFPYLLSGSTIHVIPEELRLDVGELNRYYEAHGITISFLPTQICEEFLKTGNRSLRKLLTGGDKLRQYVKTNFELVNNYGPTENTVVTTSFVTNQTYPNIPIGKPVSNSQIYILGENQQLQPVGVAGELCISGDGLARGYLNRPELTTEKFVANPYEPGERMYRTGDLARWLPDGNIEFLGRIDQQVKVRGYRIELGEIESELLNYESVKEAVVIDKEDNTGNKYLCAYLVSDQEFSVSDLRKHLARELPDYMVPSYYVPVERIPLTLNGKIDRKALPQPEGALYAAASYEAPGSHTEEILASIWQEVLEVGKIGIHDNFFNLGGHSLKATVLASRIHKEMNVEIPLREIFQRATIRELAEYMDGAAENMYAAIQPVAEQADYPVSAAQKRLYVLNQLDREGTGYNIPGVMVIEGELNRERLAETFYKLVQRHEALRTSFQLKEGEPVQIIHPAIDFEVDYQAGNEAQVQSTVAAFVRPFDLSKAPLLRVGLIKLSGHKHILMLDIHHIIADGVSMNILTEEFIRLYEGKDLSKLRIQYKDYAVWQRQLFAGEIIRARGRAKQEEYWLKAFGGEIPLLNLPTDYPRPTVQSFAGDRITFNAGRKLAEELKTLAAATGGTLYMVLLAAYNVLLSKYAGQEDIIVGSPSAGRPHADLEGIIGMFVNTLAMRNQPESGKTFKEFLLEVKANALSAYENQDYQFEELVEKLNLKRDISRNPLFDVMFALQNVGHSEAKLADVQLTPYEFENRIAKFDLMLEATEIGDGIGLSLEYCTQLFRKETIQRMAGHFLNILQEAAANPDVQLAGMDMVSEAEKEQLLLEFNRTETEYPKGQTIQELFEKQASQRSDQIAVVYGEQQLTYKELNAKANQLARLLRKKGVEAESIVGLMVERSVEMIVGIMAILKAGGAYLPIDPEYPESRIQYMLENSRTSILLTQESLLAKAKFAGELLNIQDPAIYKGSSANLKLINTPDNLAYTIYTSGTTGHPKGVMIEHKNVAALVTGLSRAIYQSYPESQRVALVAPYVFDASVKQIFAALLLGHSLYIVPQEVRVDGVALKEYYRRYAIDISDGTPAHISMLTAALADTADDLKVKHFLIGGEALGINLIQDFYQRLKGAKPKITNVYGPTECCVDSATYLVNPEKLNEFNSIPIGKPLANWELYVLGKSKEILPVGIAGELYIGGSGVGRGYLNNAELTAEKFIVNPFIAGEKMYRTGDLVKWLPDGNIEFIGRIDEQVKVRGYRIELGEIESQLLKYEPVQAAVVVAREAREEGSGNKYLCAYIVAEQELNVSDLRKHLAKELPEYMIPSYFVPLEKIPLTSNGKVDKKELPAPDGSLHAAAAYEAPGNNTEEVLAIIWQELLGIDQVGVHDNFFHLGGHSLKATVLVSRIHKAMDVEVPLREVFQRPTIRELAEYIDGARKNIYAAIPPVVEQENYPVSAAQKRLFILNQLEGESTGYNMPASLFIEGELNRGRLEETFQQLIARHEVFRTSFQLNREAEPVQIIHQKVDFKVDYLEAEAKQVQSIITGYIRAFHLNKSPLLRVGLIRLSENKHILIIDMHHIISDGVSMNIFIAEFMSLYEEKKLPGLRIQYKDYSVWQNNLFAGETIRKQEEYWLKVFSGGIPVLNLPTDYPRPTIQSFEGNRIIFGIERELAGKLNTLAAATGGTLYMVLLAAYNVMLSKYTGQEDIVVGSPIAGRPHADLESIIGMFVNTLAMRNQPESHKTFQEFLLEVKANALNAYENQDYQFEELVDKLNLTRDISRNPLFDIMFVLQNTRDTELSLAKLKLSPYDFENRIAKFDLTLTAIENKAGIEFSLEYCTKLYKKETITRMAGHFVNILREVAARPDIILDEIEMLSVMEKRQLLSEFNDTKAEYPTGKTIQEFFEEQVTRIPDQVAVVFEDRQLTYRELNGKVNQLAWVLRSKGVHSDSIVGILAERSLEMILAILGVLKAGGAYLPIDPDYPLDRINYTLEDSGTKILLTQGHLESRTLFTGETIDLDNEALYQGDDTNPPSINKPADLAYIIYTSGTTGRPKGVMIEHRNVVRLLFNDKMQFDFTNGDVWTMFHSYCFDFSVWEMYGSLLYGGKLVVVAKSTARDPQRYLQLLKQEKVTVLNQTPTAFYGLIYEELNLPQKELGLRYVVFGGEALNPIMLKDWKEKYPGTKLINMYGITETTVHVTFKEITEYEIDLNISNIGKPIPTLTTYIMDRNLRLLPIGVAGELCVGGDGVGRGYLNRPDLTGEKFVQNPYVPSERLYRSGDLARMLQNGDMEYLGRIDHQVKIRGFRIELGEIESQLLKYEPVKEVVVLAREDANKNKYLCAYIVTDRVVTVSELRAHLSKELPDYMIPAYFVPLAKMPSTSNGKIDRKALPEPDGRMDAGVEYVVPRNEKEEILVKVWQEVLKAEKIGIKDNFFNLGGDSIKAIQVLARLNGYGYKLEMKELFKNPVLEELSELLQAANREIEQGLVTGEVRLTPIQSWLFKQSFTEKHHFNQAVMLFRKEGFDENALQIVFSKLVEHHDALRMVVRTVDERITLLNRELEGELYSLEVQDLTGVDNSIPAIEIAVERIQRSIDLFEGPLVKAGLFKTKEGDHLLIVIHHLVVDGISWRVLFEDIATGYQQVVGGEEIRFKAKTDSFKDWSERLYEYANSNDLLQEIEYWQRLERSDIKPLPKDTAVAVRTNKNSIRMELTAEDSEKLLKQVNKAYNTEINDILLTALGLAVKKWTGEGRVLINLEGHGREAILKDIDISRTVGWFTAQYPVVLDMDGQKDLGNWIKSVKESLRSIPNKGIGHGMIQYLTSPEHKGTIKFQLQPEMSFNYLGQFDRDIDTGIFAISTLSAGRQISETMTSPYALSITVMVIAGKLTMDLAYDQNEYRKATVQKIARALQEFLIAIIRHCAAMNHTENTLSDFSASHLTDEKLDDIAAMVEDIE